MSRCKFAMEGFDFALLCQILSVVVNVTLEFLQSQIIKSSKLVIAGLTKLRYRLKFGFCHHRYNS